MALPYAAAGANRLAAAQAVTGGTLRFFPAGFTTERVQTSGATITS